MCLLLFQYGGEKSPVVICSNRDESLFRKTKRGAVRTTSEGVKFFAPLDEEAGGTWIAFSEASRRFAVVLNYHEWRAPKSFFSHVLRMLGQKKPHKSRGCLPMDFISAPETVTAATYAAEIAALPGAWYAGFNLIIGDKYGCYYVSNQTPGSGPHFLEPKVVHGISNGSIDDDWCKVKISRSKLSDILSSESNYRSQNDNELFSVEEAKDLTTKLFKIMQDSTPLMDPTLGYLRERATQVSAIFVNPKLLPNGQVSPEETNYGTRTTTIAVIFQNDNSENILISEKDLNPELFEWSCVDTILTLSS